MENRSTLAKHLLDIIEVCSDRLYDINHLPEEQINITTEDIEKVSQILNTLNYVSVEIPL